MEEGEIARCVERSMKMIRESNELIKKSQAVIYKSRRVKKPAGPRRRDESTRTRKEA